jgi:hypothetical protein
LLCLTWVRTTLMGRFCWAIYVIMNFITNKNHYRNYRSEKITIISDIMTKRPKTVTRTIITTHTP